MADLNQVRIQVLDANTGAVLDRVDVKTSDGAVYLPDGSTLRSWIAATEESQSEFQQKLAAHLAQKHVNPDKIDSILTGVTFDSKTGVFKIAKHDGTTEEIDTLLEKVAVNFTLEDGEAGTDDAGKTFLVLTAEDGTAQRLDVTKLIDVYTGSDGTNVVVAVSADKKISATLVEGSIGKSLLAKEVLDAIAEQYELVAATTTTLGGVIVGNGLSVDATGKIATTNVKYGDTSIGVNFATEETTAVIAVSGPADSAVITTTGTAVAPLTVTSSITGDAASAATATYQWYKKVVGTDVAFSAISGATAATLPADKIDVSTEGTTIYYCLVSATGEGVVADPVTSKRISVVVEATA
jgi:hypothetical protein